MTPRFNMDFSRDFCFFLPIFGSSQIQGPYKMNSWLEVILAQMVKQIYTINQRQVISWLQIPQNSCLLLFLLSEIKISLLEGRSDFIFLFHSYSENMNLAFSDFQGGHISYAPHMDKLWASFPVYYSSWALENQS